MGACGRVWAWARPTLVPGRVAGGNFGGEGGEEGPGSASLLHLFCIYYGGMRAWVGGGEERASPSKQEQATFVEVEMTCPHKQNIIEATGTGNYPIAVSTPVLACGRVM